VLFEATVLPSKSIVFEGSHLVCQSEESNVVLSRDLELIDLNPQPLLTSIGEGVFISNENTLYSSNCSLVVPITAKPTGYLVHE
jgi:hypothetical protein